MDKEEFNSMVKKYKDELAKYMKKNKNFPENNNTDEQENIPPDIHKIEPENISNVGTDNVDITYKEFIDSNPMIGHLKIQSFCDDEIPLSGIRVRIKKNFSDGERIFFDGYTDEEGNINDILLPAPDYNVLKDSDQSMCPHAVYDVEVSHDDYNVDCNGNVRSFSHIESVYPIKITLPKDEKNI